MTFHENIVVTATGGVTQLPACSNVLPQVNNANISNSSLKSTYAQGEKLTYICLEGYTGRIIFTCDRNEWVKTRKIECARKYTGFLNKSMLYLRIIRN